MAVQEQRRAVSRGYDGQGRFNDSPLAYLLGCVGCDAVNGQPRESCEAVAALEGIEGQVRGDLVEPCPLVQHFR